MDRILAAAAFLGLVSCAPPPATGESPASLLSWVDTSNGVSRAEAENIAKAYFSTHVGCGAFVGISSEGGNWVVEGKFGYAGEPITGFLINKKFGSITSPVGPSYKHPNDIVTQVQVGAAAGIYGAAELVR